MSLFIYEHTTSTNDLGRSRHFRHGDLIWAHSQSAGRGQRGNSWRGEQKGGDGDENIAISIILEPTQIEAVDQFRITQITALAIVDTLRHYGIETRIKWTNDIYIGDKKVAGVLIENNLSGRHLSRSIIGIGLNINQQSFDSDLPNPISMAIAAGREFSREEVMRLIHHNVMLRFKSLLEESSDRLGEEYNTLLYRLGEVHPYRLPSGEVIEATLIGVERRGELQLKWVADDITRGYLFKEVEFMIVKS